ncbi:MAG TPA: DUF2909 domain-containing protein, partial [Albitalea sp.]|nr:DUF2909 domain-containing protein [Albitalea sp.]
MKLLVALAFVAIIGALFVAGVAMVRDGRAGKPKNKNMAWALALRVGLSVALFLCILISYKLGWIR